ncbi:glycosyltransferase family 4 protein [Candidatus Woesebacteria bacterium]|nr:MAG: glycosyltransferase family 4 protein [Candidatus Woesebacteria bacterium]
MRILIGISYYYPNVSGLSIYAKNLAESLASQGHKVEVITSRHTGELEYKSKENNVSVKRVWTPFKIGRGAIMPTYVLEAYKSVKEADVVNCHIPSFEIVILVILAKLLRRKVIITHHCDLSNWPGLINQITERITYLSLLISGMLADKIVVYTKDYADSSVYLKHFKDKLVYILPPVKVVVAKKKMARIYKGIHPKIGFAGRVAREKGIKYLLEAITHIDKKITSNLKIFIAGPKKEVIGGGFEEEFNKLYKKYKSKIIYLGALNELEMADFYSMLDILVLPSIERIESFGFVQVEAMLSGCPVVASNMPGVRMPIVLSGMGELAEIRDSKSIASKITKILTSRKKYVKSQKTIQAIFNYHNTINAYGELFKNISKK